MDKKERLYKVESIIVSRIKDTEDLIDGMFNSEENSQKQGVPVYQSQLYVLEDLLARVRGDILIG